MLTNGARSIHFTFPDPVGLAQPALPRKDFGVRRSSRPRRFSGLWKPRSKLHDTKSGKRDCVSSTTGTAWSTSLLFHMIRRFRTKPNSSTTMHTGTPSSTGCPTLPVTCHLKDTMGLTASRLIWQKDREAGRWVNQHDVAP